MSGVSQWNDFSYLLLCKERQLVLLICSKVKTDGIRDCPIAKNESSTAWFPADAARNIIPQYKSAKSAHRSAALDIPSCSLPTLHCCSSSSVVRDVCSSSGNKWYVTLFENRSYFSLLLYINKKQKKSAAVPGGKAKASVWSAIPVKHSWNMTLFSQLQQFLV